MPNYALDMPLIEIPLMLPDGSMNPIWFMFFVQLFRRTGAQSGGDGQLTVGDILALEELQASPLAAQSQAAADVMVALERAQQAIASLSQQVGDMAVALETVQRANSLPDGTSVVTSLESSVACVVRGDAFANEITMART